MVMALTTNCIRIVVGEKKINMLVKNSKKFSLFLLIKGSNDITAGFFLSQIDFRYIGLL